ncbi:3-oxoacyl-[acyl-carrier-protein] reductase [Acanthopleuribacter pedis]|uniref:3-oxoacyl-[acyl-carrier-protein] reductase n=1 Tax=Acanthopleuribacter pedis TaxID=442870 RepID=A0A8J7QAC2_9BACT|nr:3-oxoacyl-[acyl-carrier-protein] reductase [Acanthopleuribacter pedis]MBO1320379.1 3-oxoacyl-[acyl-carrier-protein] reductase [Acanthopleuribacter pedis]
MNSKVALVTGGSQGIGRAICRRLAAEGFLVLVASRNLEKITSVADAICADGFQAKPVQLDVQATDSFKNVIKEITTAHGGLHVLVNNAGITADNLMARIKPEAFDSVVNTNLRGAFFLSQAVLRPMMKQRWGRIINITSVVGLMGNAGQANYAASKAGLVGVTKSLAKEVGSRAITVNAVAPGYIETDMTGDLSDQVTSAFMEQVPLGRMGQPDDIAHAVAYLASEGAAYVTGQVLTVDGGLYM